MSISKWKLIKRRTVLSHKRLHLVEDAVVLPDGSMTDYLRLAPGQADSVAVIAVNELGQILLQKEFSYPPNEILWQLPGGGVNTGETLEAAAIRELSEESGYSANRVEVIGYFYTNNRRSDQKQYVIICEELNEHLLKHDDEEFIESFWLNLPEVEKMIAGGGVTNINLLAALKVWQSKKKEL